MSEHMDGGELHPPLGSEMEMEKGKEIVQGPDLHSGKGGEGTSGIIKEAFSIRDSRKPGHYVPK